MEPKFTEQQSLAVMAEMIERTRNNIGKNSGFSMVYYGYAVAAIALANFTLIATLDNPNRSFLVWWLMLPVSIVGFFLQNRIDRSAIVRSQIDTIVNAIWRGFAVSVFSFLAVIFSIAIYFDSFNVMMLCTPVIMLMVGAGEFATAKACRFKPFLTGAYIFWAGALLCVPVNILGIGGYQMIILAIAMITGFAIPGHSLNKKARQNV